MPDPIFKAMKDQMRPDDQLLARLEQRLAAADAAEEAGPAVGGEQLTVAETSLGAAVTALNTSESGTERNAATFPTPAIASSIEASEPTPAATPVASPATARRWRRPLWWAAAAGLLVVGVAFGGLFGSGLWAKLMGENPSGSTSGAVATVGDQSTVLGVGSLAVRTAADYASVYSAIQNYYSQTTMAGLGGPTATSMSVDQAATAVADNGANSASEPTAPPQATDSPEITNITTSDPAPDTLPQSTDTPQASDSPEISPLTEPAASDLPLAASTDDTTSQPDYSTANNQVAAVDEPDIIKTDGRYIYTLSHVPDGYSTRNILSIFAADGANTRLLSQIELDSSNSGIIPLVGADAGMSTAPANNSAAVDAGAGPVSIDLAPTSTTNISYNDILLAGNTLALISTVEDYSNNYYDSQTRVQLYDVSDPSQPAMVWDYGQSGTYHDARLLAGQLYLISSYYLFTTPEESDPASYVPSSRQGAEVTLCPPADICIMPVVNGISYTVVSSLDLVNHQQSALLSILGNADTIYMNTANLYIASAVYQQDVSDPYTESVYTITDVSEFVRTQITRISLADGGLVAAAQGAVDGALLSQFSLDEYQGNLRLAVTIDPMNYQILSDPAYDVTSYRYQDPSTSNALYVLGPDLTTIGSLTDLAAEERIYSVRFLGEIGYLVTFRQTDPLMAIDLANPQAPRLLSQLELPGFSRYLHSWSSDLLLGLGQNTDQDWAIKLAMFDVADPTAVRELQTLNLGITYTPALDNHLAILVDPTRNLIGFADETGNYLVFSYGDGGFQQLASLALFSAAEQGAANIYAYYGVYDTRGLYINDSLYVFSGTYLDVFSMADWQSEARIQIAQAQYPADFGGGLVVTPTIME